MSYGFCNKFHNFQQSTKCEHRLRFDKVTESIKVETFLRHSVEILLIPIHSKHKYNYTIGAYKWKLHDGKGLYINTYNRYTYIQRNYRHKIKKIKWRYYEHKRLSLVVGLLGVIYEWAVPFCSDVRNGANCKMLQTERNSNLTHHANMVIANIGTVEFAWVASNWIVRNVEFAIKFK